MDVSAEAADLVVKEGIQAGRLRAEKCGGAAAGLEAAGQ